MSNSIFIYALRQHIDSGVLSFAEAKDAQKDVSVDCVVHGIEDEAESGNDLIEVWLYARSGSLPLREIPLAEGISLLRSCEHALPESELDPLYEHAHLYAIPLDEDTRTLVWLDTLNKDASRVYTLENRV